MEKSALREEWAFQINGWEKRATTQEWRDSHYRIVGPGVTQLRAAFTDNWLTVLLVVLHDEAYFPEIKPQGEAQTQFFKSSLREGAASSQLLYLLSLAAACETIHIAMAYFVPGDLAIEQLIKARKRGVSVEIIVQGELADSKAVRHSSRYLYGPLLKERVKIYEFQPNMYHCKVLIVDGA